MRRTENAARSRFLSAAVASFTVCLAGAVSAGEPIDRIVNGGFEEGFVGWNPDANHQLVEGRQVARTGDRCVTGEVTKPLQALMLRRKVAVRAANRYRFEIWARATNRTKLVLWVVQPRTGRREMVASWRQVPAKWTRYTTSLTARADGQLEMQIVAPSSHGEPPGRIWVDDVALYETELPPILDASRGEGFNDEPAMATAGDGAIWVAWNSFRDGADSLQLARFTANPSTAPGATPLLRGGAWQLVGGKGTYVLGPCVVRAGDAGVATVWAQEIDGRWDIRFALCGRDGPGKIVSLPSDVAVDVKPSAASRDGTLWIAWESNRDGVRRVHASSARDGTVSPPVALSSAIASGYDPTLTVLESGEVCVAWHSFHDNNFDVFLRRRGSDGTWHDERRLTQAPTIDRHARLFSRGDELWIAWENAQTQTYRIGTTNRRRLLVARVTQQGLLAPRHPGRSPLAGRCEAADAKFDASGRLWMSFLGPRLPRSGWDVFVTHHDGKRWQTPTVVSTLKGMDRQPHLALTGSTAFVAFQADTLPNSWSDVDKTADARSDVFVAELNAGAARAPAKIGLEPLVESDEPFEAAALRIARGEDTPTPKIEYRDEELKLFFGDLHEHTEISVCNRVGDQSVNESYQHMRDIARHDFACVTDHGYNLNPYLWGYTAKLARTNDDPGRFLTFLAEEWTSSFEKYDAKHPYGYYGHRNLILADLYFPRWWNARNGQTPAQVWEDLRKLQANFVHIPHQIADTGNVPTDWDFVDEVAQPVAEIFQVRGSYEHKGAPREAGRSTPKAGYFLQDAWARGVVIGVIASPDHGGGYGKACVWAPKLTREAVLDALRARRCYGTTGAKIVLDVRVDGHLMGEKVATPAGESVRVDIRVRCPMEIDRVEVCRNNRFVYTREIDGKNAEFTFVDREPVEGRSWYYVRVLQEDEEIAWSSPVWFGAE